MAWELLIKPRFDNGGGGLLGKRPGTYIIRGPDGQVLETVQTQSTAGHEGYKGQSRAIQAGLPPGSTIEFEGTTYNLDGPAGARFEFSYGNSSPTAVGDKGAIGGSGGGFPQSGFNPVNIGEFGVAPGYLGGQFPSPNFATFTPATPADYKYTDPFKFGETFAEFNRLNIARDFGLAKDIGMSELELELKGLQKFAPAAAALAREQISIDNQFNQQQRLQQVESALPGARESLAAQTGRAETYAKGRFIGDIEDRAFELGIRSSAADRAVAGGFGPTSSVARKASDLLSAEQRFQVAQYGEGLLSKSIGERSNLLLAPTEYSTAGSQIKVMPSVDLGTRVAGNLQQINQATLIPPSTALQSEIQQQQFGTQLQQQLNIFNAQGGFDASKFNAQTGNQFALDKFGYDVGYATSVASGTQTDINTQAEINQQNEAKNTFEDNKEATQDSGTIGAIATLGAAFAPGIIDWVNSSLAGETATTTSSAGLASTPEANANWNAAADAATNMSLRSLAFARTQAPVSAPEQQDLSTKADNFEKTTKRKLPVDRKSQDGAKVMRALDRQAKAPLAAAGISNTPGRDGVLIGYDTAGKPLFSSKRMLQNPNPNAGARRARSTDAMLRPFGFYNEEDSRRINLIGSRASDRGFLTTLDSHKANNDFDSFANAINTMLFSSTGSNTQPLPRPTRPASNSFLSVVEE